MRCQSTSGGILFETKLPFCTLIYLFIAYKGQRDREKLGNDLALPTEM